MSDPTNALKPAAEDVDTIPVTTGESLPTQAAAEPDMPEKIVYDPYHPES